MKLQLLLKGGTIVDGTGAPAYRGDLRIKDGRIAEIAPMLEPQQRERVVDATGCYVTPGFFENHNHWDGGIWWIPTMDPLPAYGATTSINGNCGFSMAPASDDPAVRADVVEIFNFFEDIPDRAMTDIVPWSWRRWSEMQATLKAKVKLPLNYASYCGHIALRLAVMGLAAWERAATPDEVRRMCDHLQDAIDAGALGLSSNLLDNDKHDRPVPSKLADDAEWGALMDVVAANPGATMQVILDSFFKQNAPDQALRLAALAEPRGVKIMMNLIPTLAFQEEQRTRSEPVLADLRARSGNFYHYWHHFSPTSMMNFERSLIFAQNGNMAWNEIIEAPTEEAKLALLADPEWRQRGREAWDKLRPHSTLRRPETMLLRDSETGYGPVNVTLADYMAQTGIDNISDALAEWVLTNGTKSTILKETWTRNEARLVELIRDPKAIGNVSDSGAHGKMFCGAGDNVGLLTDFVRDKPLVSIEEAVHLLTGRSAAFFNLTDRGTLEVGKRADVLVFDLMEIERRPEIKTWDVPDGEGGRTYRYTREAAPMRLTLVNGVPTFDHGAFTGNFPGQFIGPELDQAPALAEAAE